MQTKRHYFSTLKLGCFEISALKLRNEGWLTPI